MFMHSFNGGEQLLRLGSIFLPYSMCLWWRDVLRESTFEGHHTQVDLDMVLFRLSYRR